METESIAAGVAASSAYKILNQYTNGPIAMCEHRNELAMVYRDDRNDSFWLTHSPDGINWYNAIQIENQQLYDVAAIASFKGHLYIVYKDDRNSRLWVTYGDWDSGANWKVYRLGEQLSDGPLCLVSNGRYLHLLYQDDKTVYKNWYTRTDDGTDWSKPVEVMQQQQMEDGGGNAAMAMLNGRLFVVYRDASNDKMWSTHQFSNGNFNTPAVITDQFTKGPITLTFAHGALYLVYADNTKSKIWVTKSTDGERWSKPHELENQQMKYAAGLAALERGISTQVWLTYRDDRKTQLWSTRID